MQIKNLKQYTFTLEGFETTVETPILDSKGRREKTLISIIVPVYQEEKIIEQTLSLYRKEILQRYNAELIVSDGGSSDRTIELAKNFTRKIALHQGNYRQTISEGRNKGAMLADGDVFVFINGDTLPFDLEKFLAFVYKWALSKDSAGALAIKVRGFPSEEVLKDKIFYFLHNNYVRLLNIFGIGMGRGECQIVRRELFERVGGYNPRISAGEDFDLFRRLSKHTKIRFVDKIYVYESPRRFRKYGYIKTVWKWLLNGFFVMFWGRSYSDHWEPIR